MKLLTKELARKLKPLGETGEMEAKDIEVFTKFFLPFTQWEWYPVEFSKEEGLFFGYVAGLCPELGYFSLKEIEELKGTLGMKVERDRWFSETSLAKVIEEVKKRY